MSQLSELLKKIMPFAPTVAGLLGGPGAGLAVEALGSALGLSGATKDSVTEKLASMQMTGDQILQLKQAELALQTKMKELEITEEQLQYADLDSARKREIAVRDSTPRNLAYIYTAGFFGLLGMQFVIILQHIQIDPSALRMLDTTTGILFAMMLGSKEYYFGSSKSSQEKTAMLYNSTPAK